MHAIASRRVFEILTVLAVASAVTFAGCGGSTTTNERAKPVGKLSPEDEASFKAMSEKAQAEVARKKAEEEAKPKPKTKGAPKRGMR